MENAVLLFYIGGICEKVTVVAGILVGLCVIMFIVSTICSLTFDMYIDDDENRKTRDMAKRWIKWSIIFGIPLAIIAMFTPNSKTMYVLSGIYASKYVVTETAVGKELNKEAVNMVKDIGAAIHKLAIDDTKELK